MADETSTTATNDLIHNLFSREFRPIRDWQEWLERWQAATTSEEMVGLLHNGFNLPIRDSDRYSKHMYHDLDRVLFYLTIADGWNDADSLSLPSDTSLLVNGHHRSQGSLRQEVARKAFDVLCCHYFKPEVHGSPNEDRARWEHNVLSEPRLAAIQCFFAVQQSRYGSRMLVRNFPDERRKTSYSQHALRFITVVIDLIWGWKEKSSFHSGAEERKRVEEANQTTRARVEEAKLWTIDVLACTDQLDWLEKRLGTFDASSLAKLEEIALRAEILDEQDRYGKKRKVKTIDEACYVGSKAAWLLKKHELELDEGARLAHIRDAIQARNEADRKIAALTNQSS